MTEGGVYCKVGSTQHGAEHDRNTDSKKSVPQTACSYIVLVTHRVRVLKYTFLSFLFRERECVCVCMDIPQRMCGGQKTTNRSQFLLPCGSRELNSDHHLCLLSRLASPRLDFSFILEINTTNAMDEPDSIAHCVLPL